MGRSPVQAFRGLLGECKTGLMALGHVGVGPMRPVPTNGQLADWSTRAWAYLLDWCIAGLPSYFLVELCNQGSVGRLIGYLLFPFVTVVYAGILIGRYGRTLGMRLFHVRAIHAATGQDLTTREAWIRAMVAFVLYGLTGFILTLIEWSQPTAWTGHHHSIVLAFDALQFVLYLALLMPIWDSRNQTLQDKAVGSIVVDW